MGKNRRHTITNSRCCVYLDFVRSVGVVPLFVEFLSGLFYFLK